jgi:hypothetical protein
VESESGQATVEWVGLVLLVALSLGALLSFAPRVDGRSLGVLIASRITGHQERPPIPRMPPQEATPTPLPPPKSAGGLLAPLRNLRGKRLVKLLREGGRQGAALNGLVCYLKKSTAHDDTNRLSDDIGDAINCVNPLSGFTGDVGGTDDG